MMDYDLLLEGCCELGCTMLGCGAEIWRVEDTVHRLLAAYNISGEVFAIPNCLIVSIADGEGRLHTRMHRASPPKTDVAMIESCNALSRKLCAAPPKDPAALIHEVYGLRDSVPAYPLPLVLVGYLIGSFFFTLFFGGGLLDAAAAAFAGVLAGLSATMLGRLRCNFFISTVISGFLMASAVYLFPFCGVALRLDAALTGGLMALVPGLVFTSFLSDLLSGDVMAGLSTFVRAMLTALAIAVGTCLSMTVFRDMPEGPGAVKYPVWFVCAMGAVACYGFCLTFNIRGRGSLLCCLGGGLGWMVYELVLPLSGGAYLPTFCAALAVALYAEIMARVRKCPASAYLIVSFFPLVPGVSIYQALYHGIRGDMEQFFSTFFHTFGVAGCLALGSLIVTSAVRAMHLRWRHR